MQLFFFRNAVIPPCVVTRVVSYERYVTCTRTYKNYVTLLDDVIADPQNRSKSDL